MWPSTRIFSPLAPAVVRSAQLGRSRPSWKNGPTVCDGVVTDVTSRLHGRRRAAAQNDVEAVAERILGLAEVRIVARDQTRARFSIGRALKDWIEVEERIAREIHLGDETRGEGRPEDGEMDMSRPPGVMGVAPRIGARLDGQEAICALRVGQHLSRAGEVGIERRVMLI